MGNGDADPKSLSPTVSTSPCPPPSLPPSLPSPPPHAPTSFPINENAADPGTFLPTYLPTYPARKVIRNSPSQISKRSKKISPHACRGNEEPGGPLITMYSRQTNQLRKSSPLLHQTSQLRIEQYLSIQTNSNYLTYLAVKLNVNISWQAGNFPSAFFPFH